MRAGRLRTWRMPRPVIRTLLPFLRCFTTRPTKSSSAPVASFLVMPVFSASSAATFDSGTVGTDGLVVGVAIVRGPLRFCFANLFLTPQGRVDKTQGYPGIRAPKVPKARKMSFFGAFSAFWGTHPQTAERAWRVGSRPDPDFQHRREQLAVR